MQMQRYQLIGRFKSLFNYVVELVFGLMLLFLMLGIAIGAAKLFLNLKDMVTVGQVTGTYLKTISDVLSLFILIELSRSLVDYFDNNRLRMTYIVDAGIVFILREIMIKLFDNKLPADQIYALSVLLFTLTVLRIGSALLYQREVAARGVSST
jgi:uncharacterized membrane protein (DUF373 family)